MDVIATFPAGDTATKELFQEWNRMGASIDVASEKRFVGGEEILTAITVLTPLITFLIGRYYDRLMNREITVKVQGVTVLAKGYSVEKVAELLREFADKDG